MVPCGCGCHGNSYGGLDTSIVSYPADTVGRDAVAYKVAKNTTIPTVFRVITTENPDEVPKYSVMGLRQPHQRPLSLSLSRSLVLRYLCRLC